MSTTLAPHAICFARFIVLELVLENVLMVNIKFRENEMSETRKRSNFTIEFKKKIDHAGQNMKAGIKCIFLNIHIFDLLN
jgi:hypothetical protein